MVQRDPDLHKDEAHYAMTSDADKRLEAVVSTVLALTDASLSCGHVHRVPLAYRERAELGLLTSLWCPPCRAHRHIELGESS